MMATNTPLPHIVIIGAGFGGLAAAERLKRHHVRITIIDRHNYHLFQPFLYQVACGGLAPSDVAIPIRSLFRKFPNVTVWMDAIKAVNLEKKLVITQHHTISFDYLIIAPGSEENYFGHNEWKDYSFSLKSLNDAVAIRQKLLLSFEQAELVEDEQEKRRLLTFAVIGGGPTGVEMAGAIAELAREMIRKEYRSLSFSWVSIYLIEAGPRILATFPEHLSQFATNALIRKGVEVRCSCRVEKISATGITVTTEDIPTSLVIWAAGVKARPVQAWLGNYGEAGKAGKIKVQGNLSLSSFPTVFVIGDAAEVSDEAGRPLPGLAAVAAQQGRYAAEVILRALAGKTPKSAFRYRNYGSMATIGTTTAVADFGFMTLKGWLAWLVWGIAHIYFLIGFRNRLMVFINWLWLYVTRSHTTSLIVKEQE